MRQSLIPILLLAVGCAEPAVWHGIELPDGTTVQEEHIDEHETATAILDVPDGAEPLASGLAGTLGGQWRQCPRWDWPWVGSTDVTSFAVWADPAERRVLVASTDDSATRLTLFVWSESWELLHAAFCEDRDRALYSPLTVSSAMDYCDADRTAARFSAERWASGDAAERGTITPDLMCRGLVLGLGPDEVVALLGEPDSREGQRLAYTLYSESLERYYGPVVISEEVACEPNTHVLEFDYASAATETVAGVLRLGPSCIVSGD